MSEQRESTADEPPSIPSPAAAPILHGRYEPERVITESASGTTWLVRDVTVKEKRRFVVKVFPAGFPNAGRAAESFVARLSPLRAKRIPGLPRLEDVRESEGRHLMVIEWSDAEPLDQIITAHKTQFPTETARHLVYTLARSMAELHNLGFLHLDLKPANVLYDRAQGVLRLLDWGHAIAASGRDRPATTLSGGQLNAVPYMSFEQLHGGAPSASDDVYALACIAYELLTGAHPFARRSAVEVASLGLVPARQIELTDAENELLASALSPRRSGRPVTLAQFAEVFGPVQVEQTPLATPLRSWRNRVPAASVTLTVAAIAIAVVVNQGVSWPEWLTTQRTAQDVATQSAAAVKAENAKTENAKSRSSNGSADSLASAPRAAIDGAARDAQADTALTSSTAVAATPVVIPATLETALTLGAPGNENAATRTRPRNDELEAKRIAAARLGSFNTENENAPIMVSTTAILPTATIEPAPAPTVLASVTRTTPTPTPPPAAERANTCPTCECASLESKRSFTNEPLRSEEQAFLRSSCR